ncbi:MFS transporter [Reinekea sp. G2M2-21]|uniref:MFS transporter n=1 Tax=Reinekea sp. G2M2-21 TaxID=2788942 RepID=UPI0018A8D656|nr:MFS transporter [Reinekea sp. G2M2-21]
MTVVNPLLPVKKREIFGWAMYDFANSSYTTVVVTFVYSAFFVSYIVPPELAHFKNTFWSIAVALSTALAIILAPLVGVLCDYSGKKKKYLAWCTMTSVGATLGLFLVNPGQVWIGLTLLVLSNTAWMLSESFIASFLTDLSDKSNMGKISGIGWGIGYIGGLLSLILMKFIITADAGENSSDFIDQNQLSMLIIALFYFLGALPTFLLVKERGVAREGFEKANFKTLLRAAFTRLSAMKQIIGEYPILFKFFLAFTAYSAGVAVVVKFFGIYTQQEVGITGGDYVLIGIILQVSAALGAVCFGFIEDKIGSKNTVLVSIMWWIVGILGIYFIKVLVSLSHLDIKLMYTIVSFIAGSALGATQSASRAIVGQLAKPQDSALLFGLWGTFGRFAIIIGMTFGPISDLLSRQTALLFILVYFIVGALMLLPIQINKGIQENVN